MELSPRQIDALTELINIGYARAAAALSDLTGHRISLEVPEVSIQRITEICDKLQNVITGEVASVNQVFSGPFTGNAILLLDREAALLLNRLLTDRPDMAGFDGAAREVITEVGNIVLNACLGAFGNLLKVQVTFTVPSLQIESVQTVLRSITIADKKLEFALIIHTRFHMRVNDVSGYLVIILGVASLERLLEELKKWEEKRAPVTEGPMSRSGDNVENHREGALLSWINQFAPYGVITLDRSLQVQSWNRWMEIHSGLRSEDVAGKSILTLYPDLEERKLVSPFARALSGESSVLSTVLHHYLLPLASPSGEFGPPRMLQTARIAPLISGKAVCGVVVVIEDVTQREVQAEALNRQHRRDKVLSWALAHFLKSNEPRNSIRQLFFKIAEHLDFDTFFLYMRDLETGTLGLYTSGGLPPDMEAEFSDSALFQRVANSREIAVLDSVRSRSEPEYEPLKKAGVSAAIAIPLFFNEQSLGLLCFATWSRESIAADESDLLRTISHYLAISVDRENTSQQLQKARRELSNYAQNLEKQVEERTTRLQETISELEIFSYSLAHDLKAPLRGIIGYCQVLQEDFGAVLPPAANLIVQKLSMAPKRMEGLIRDLLHFSEVSRGEVVLSPVDLESIIENLLALRAPSVREATKVCAPLHRVRGQKDLLQQVLANLLDNAVKFINPATTPSITVFSEVIAKGSPNRSLPLLFNVSKPAPAGDTMAMPATGTSEQIRLWVQDEGIGIPPEMHQKIFGIFERGVSTNLYEGTGMGLAIVARAMQRMGGRCGVESQLGKGSRFWIELPSA